MAETRSADEIIEACIKAAGDALPECKNSDECPLWYDGCHCQIKGDDNKVVMAMRALKGKFVLPAEVSSLTKSRCGVECVGCEKGRCEAPKDDGPHDHMCDRCDAAVAGVTRKPASVEELQKLVQAAHSLGGAWSVEPYKNTDKWIKLNGGDILVDNDDVPNVPVEQGPAFAAYIAATRPDVILGLLAERDALIDRNFKTAVALNALQEEVARLRRLKIAVEKSCKMPDGCSHCRELNEFLSGECPCCADPHGDPEGLCFCIEGCPGRGSNHGWEHSGGHE